MGLLTGEPDQCTANRYSPGQGIPAHIDSHSCCGPEIASLSLGSGIVMNFTAVKKGRRTKDVFPVFLPPRSLLVMKGRARYAMAHGIASRATDVVPSSSGSLTLHRRGTRVSLTFRETIREPCRCNHPENCDSRDKDEEKSIDGKVAAALESLHVHSVYEKIADHFSQTRHKAWPGVSDFLSSLPAFSVLVDAGCGNGKYLGHQKGQFQFACDYSQALLKICRSRGFEAVRSNCLKLPFRPEVADAVISIAVIHHLSTKERRLKALREMARVLRPHGRGLVYVWAKNQAVENKPSRYLKQKQGEEPEEEAHNEFRLPVHTNRTNFEHSDLLVPWKKREKREDVTFHRYYHVFEEGELMELVGAVKGVRVVRDYYDQGNWCVLFEKLEE